MSAQENEALVRCYFEEGWVTGNLAAVEDFMVPNYMEHQVPDVQVASRDGLEQLLAMYYKAFPDMKCVFHDIFAQGDKVAFRWSVSGTHLGDWVGIPRPVTTSRPRASPSTGSPGARRWKAGPASTLAAWRKNSGGSPKAEEPTKRILRVATSLYSGQVRSAPRPSTP
jgi:predicted ester cyclase